MPRRKVMAYPSRLRKKRRTQEDIAAEENADDKAPKSFVIRRGKVFLLSVQPCPLPFLIQFDLSRWMGKVGNGYYLR
eukprot:54020-Amorphochlora_amoeboformis.AAC.2